MATLFLVAWGIVAFAVGAWFGLKLPDVDQRTDLLLHRSIITHGPLVPLVLFLVLGNVQRTWVRMLPVSVCLGPNPPNGVGGGGGTGDKGHGGAIVR